MCGFTPVVHFIRTFETDLKLLLRDCLIVAGDRIEKEVRGMDETSRASRRAVIAGGLAGVTSLAGCINTNLSGQKRRTTLDAFFRVGADGNVRYAIETPSNDTLDPTTVLETSEGMITRNSQFDWSPSRRALDDAISDITRVAEREGDGDEVSGDLQSLSDQVRESDTSGVLSDGTYTKGTIKRDVSFAPIDELGQVVTVPEIGLTGGAAEDFELNAWVKLPDGVQYSLPAGGHSYETDYQDNIGENYASLKGIKGEPAYPGEADLPDTGGVPLTDFTDAVPTRETPAVVVPHRSHRAHPLAAVLQVAAQTRSLEYDLIGQSLDYISISEARERANQELADSLGDAVGLITPNSYESFVVQGAVLGVVALAGVVTGPVGAGVVSQTLPLLVDMASTWESIDLNSIKGAGRVKKSFKTRELNPLHQTPTSAENDPQVIGGTLRDLAAMASFQRRAVVPAMTNQSLGDDALWRPDGSAPTLERFFSKQYARTMYMSGAVKRRLKTGADEDKFDKISAAGDRLRAMACQTGTRAQLRKYTDCEQNGDAPGVERLLTRQIITDFIGEELELARSQTPGQSTTTAPPTATQTPSETQTQTTTNTPSPTATPNGVAVKFRDGWEDGNLDDPLWQGGKGIQVVRESAPDGGSYSLRMTSDGRRRSPRLANGVRWDAAWTLDGLFRIDVNGPEPPGYRFAHNIQTMGNRVSVRVEGPGSNSRITNAKLTGEYLDTETRKQSVRWTPETWHRYTLRHDGDGTYKLKFWNAGETEPDRFNVSASGRLPPVELPQPLGYFAYSGDKQSVHHAYVQYVTDPARS